MTSSRALAAAGSLAVALLAALPADARAAACCVGSTSPFPIRVGECEKVVAGFSAGHERALGRWDRDGALADVGVPESAVLADLGVGVRFNRRRPGNRGMGRDIWCRVSPDGDADKTAIRRAYITSSSGRSRVRLVHESGTVRRGVIRNHAEPSEAHRAFRPMC